MAIFSLVAGGCMRKKRKLNFWDNTKICSKCKRSKELSEFHRNKSKMLNCESACKSCTSLTKKKRYIEKKNEDRFSHIIPEGEICSLEHKGVADNSGLTLSLVSEYKRKQSAK